MRHRPTSGPAAATAGPCIEKQSAGRAFRPTSCGHGAVDFCVIFGTHPPTTAEVKRRIVSRDKEVMKELDGHMRNSQRFPRCLQPLFIDGVQESPETC